LLGEEDVKHTLLICVETTVWRKEFMNRKVEYERGVGL
jgi:hypothetical protein